MIYYDHQYDDVRAVVWHVTEDSHELLSLLPDADTVREEAERRFRAESRRKEWIAVRVLLYTVLERQIEIGYNSQGAPLLPSYEGLNLSISHTRGYVAIALSETTRVGIDVEQIERRCDDMPTRVEKIRDRFVSAEEFADTSIGLLLHWSAKESVFKLLGREGVNFHDDLQVQPFDETNYEGTLQLTDTVKDDTYDVNYKVFDEFVLTVTKA